LCNLEVLLADKSLAALTALTSLNLRDCRTSSSTCNVLDWLASQAYGLTNLEQLLLSTGAALDDPSSSASSSSSAEAFAAILAHPGLKKLHMLELRELHLPSNFFYTIDSCFSRLQHLISAMLAAVRTRC
jgi:hypothetical protein